MQEITIGSHYTTTIYVKETDLANHVGSGTVEVFATPRMIAVMEQAAASCLAQFLDENETSVGVQIATTHVAATPCGMKVETIATIQSVDHKRVCFEIIAKDEVDLIGTATHERVIVHKETFETRAKAKGIQK